jgi:hypothetical protein
VSLINLIKDLIEEKIMFESQFGLKELIMFKDLIKLLMNFVYSIKDSIEKQLSLKV